MSMPSYCVPYLQMSACTWHWNIQFPEKRFKQPVLRNILKSQLQLYEAENGASLVPVKTTGNNSLLLINIERKKFSETSELQNKEQKHKVRGKLLLNSLLHGAARIVWILQVNFDEQDESR